MKKGLFFLFVLAVLASCNKDEDTPLYNIRYEVDVSVADSIKIEYHSDYYHASGELEQINPFEGSHTFMSGNIWVGRHSQTNRNDPYYIRITYEGYNNPQNVIYNVRVLANDTLLLDSFTDSLYTPVVELTGTVPSF
jgi:hypothetical protein